MSFNFSEFKTELKKALDLFDKKEAERLCIRLIEFLNAGNSKDILSKDLENVLAALRNKRMFDLMQRVADCYIQNGRGTYKICRQYAQSLIDLGIYAGSLCVLTQLRNDTANDSTPAVLTENKEAIGLTGRIYKQVYVNAANPGNSQFVESLKLALKNYQEGYLSGYENYLWHGINMVALLKRAAVDHVEITGFPDPDEEAGKILEIIAAKDADKKADTWDFATAMEACVALNKADEALEWMNKYVNAPYTDAFELGSTLRQLQEVWKLDISKGIGAQVLPVLNSSLLKREGANVILDASVSMRSHQNDPDFVKKLQKVLGADSYKTYKWYLKGLQQCSSVVRIGKDASKGFGTGFLMKGGQLHPSLTDEVVIMTNAHVVSDTPGLNNNSLVPEQAVIILETVDKDIEMTVKEKTFWSSSINELDVSILLLDDESKVKISAILGKISFYKNVKLLPIADGKQRVYIIGHPAGGTLQISLQDNVLLDHKTPFLHYRTPTTGGSSGSPVFNDNWDLIGIHHAGDEKMQKLDGSGEMYEANEGIWIQSVIDKLAEKK